MKYIIKNKDGVRACVLALAEAGVFDNKVVALVGDLGAGKTTLTQGIAAWLGVASTVQSPTYTILKSYKNDHDVVCLCHIDAYRADENDVLHALESCESDALCVVEWADRVSECIPSNAQWLSIQPLKDNTRLVEIVKKRP